MPELRQNIATKEWVIISTERAKRPTSYIANQPSPTPPPFDPHCPFCPGNEERDLELLTLPAQGLWHLRVVCNKYPALQREGPRTHSFEGVSRRLSGVGYHEVLVESRYHHTHAAREPVESLDLLLYAFQLRGREISQDLRIQHIVYYKNHGVRAGSSMIHPHAQLIGLPVVPFSIRARTDEARRYFDDTGECVYCRMLRDEWAEQQRIIAANAHHVAFVPYAAASPFHIWILPRRHDADFLRLPPAERYALAEVLHRVLCQLDQGLNNPDYNFVLRSVPVRDPGDEYLHWYLAIVTRVTRNAGFELASGMFINPTLPEASAAFLRSVLPL